MWRKKLITKTSFKLKRFLMGISFSILTMLSSNRNMFKKFASTRRDLWYKGQLIFNFDGEHNTVMLDIPGKHCRSIQCHVHFFDA